MYGYSAPITVLDEGGQTVVLTTDIVMRAIPHAVGSQIFLRSGGTMLSQSSTATINSALDTRWDEYLGGLSGTGNSKTLADHYATVGNSGTSETDLYSDTLANNQLGADGEKISAYYGGSYLLHATATRQIKIYFGGTAIFDSGALVLASSSAWVIYVQIIRISATAIRYMVSLNTQGTSADSFTSAGELTGLTLSNQNILKITGTAAAAGAASNDIQAKLGSIAWHAAA